MGGALGPFLGGVFTEKVTVYFLYLLSNISGDGCSGLQSP